MLRSPNCSIAPRAIVMQTKTQRPVQFQITEQTRDAARKVETTHVLFNNNYQDQGQRGARALTAMLATRK